MRASACSTSSVRVRSTIPGTRHGADQNVNERVQRWLSRTRHLEKPVVPDIRGKVTIADVVDVAPEEYAAAVHRWAGSVWGAWREHHTLARAWIAAAGAR